jgi:hypothetical protein
VNSRRRAKLAKKQQEMSTCPNPESYTLNEWRQQERHERHVFGHTDAECTCTPEQVDSAVSWNAPVTLWMGRGHAYHRRIRARAKRR